MRWCSNILIFFFKVYHLLISPVLHTLAGPGGGCRFEPTCSRYAVEALRVHGMARGTAMIFRRICKCHPWGGGGYDPVPLAQCSQCTHSHSNGS